MKDETIKKLLEYLDQTKDFVLDQAPQVFKEMLRYEFLISVLQTCLGFILLFIAAFVFFKCYTSEIREPYGSRPLEHQMGMFIPLLVVTFILIFIADGVCDSIKIKMTPKYYILQQLKG